MLDQQREWFWLRLDYLRERADLDGTESDLVALATALLVAQRSTDGRTLADEAAAVLTTARDRYASSVAVWEHTVLYHSIHGTTQDTNQALGVLARLDPRSRLLEAAMNTGSTESQQWAQDADATQRQLLTDAGSPDADVSAAAMSGLRDWARSFPRSSTYAINLGLGLASAGHSAEAIQVAAAACELDDGSFADSYNLALVFGLSADYQRSRACSELARARCTDPAEVDLLDQLVRRWPADG